MEKAVHAATYDLAFIRRVNFQQYINDLRAFVQMYPTGERVDHLPAYADTIEKLDAEAIGFYGTSVSENLWWRWDEAAEQSFAVPLSNGFEVYANQ
jgi:hypothetical protein